MTSKMSRESYTYIEEDRLVRLDTAQHKYRIYKTYIKNHYNIYII